MDTYVATMGATDGNIMAAIITTHVTMKNVSAPGPIAMSMPAVRAPVTTQARAASPTSVAKVAIRHARNGSSRHE